MTSAAAKTTTTIATTTTIWYIIIIQCPSTGNYAAERPKRAQIPGR